MLSSNFAFCILILLTALAVVSALTFFFSRFRKIGIALFVLVGLLVVASCYSWTSGTSRAIAATMDRYSRMRNCDAVVINGKYPEVALAPYLYGDPDKDMPISRITVYYHENGKEKAYDIASAKDDLIDGKKIKWSTDSDKIEIRGKDKHNYHLVLPKSKILQSDSKEAKEYQQKVIDQQYEVK